MLGDRRRRAFVEAMERYIDGYLTDMGVEEREVLPAAFAAYPDPLTGRHEADETFRPLFRKLVMTAPAPVGLG